MAATDPPHTSMPEVPSTLRRGLRAALHAADFRRLWVATIASHVGTGMQQVLLGWLVLVMTGSDSMVGIIFAVRSTPNLLVGLGVGALTDRLDRRLLMRLAGFGITLSTLAVAGLLWADRLQVWQLLVYAGMLGTLQALEMTARQVYVYDTLGMSGAAQGIALISMAQRLGSAGGALLAGVVLQWWGAGTAFLIMSVSAGASVGVLYALRQAGVAAPLWREPLGQNLRAYLRTLRTNQTMRSLMISTAIAEILGFSHQVMLPILAKEVLHVGAAGLGVLTAFRFLGGTLGVVLFTVLSTVRRQGMLLLVVLGLFGSSEMVLGYAAHFWLAIVCVTFINVMAAIADVLHQTLLQYSVSNEQRGRAMGAWVVGVGTAPLGHLQIGSLAGLAGAQTALAVNGLALVVLTVSLAIGLPRLRRL
jgi:MFS family permease